MIPRSMQILPAFDGGGVERATLDWVCHLRMRGAESFVASKGGRCAAIIEKLGGVHITLPLTTKNPFKILFNAWRLAKVIRQHDIQVVHARSRAPAWSAWLACKMTNARFITTYHGMYGDQNIFKRLYNSVMARGERVITISGHLTRYVEKTYPVTRSAIRRIDEGIDVDFFSPAVVKEADIQRCHQEWNVTPDHKVIILPGFFSERKGQLFALEAFKRVKDPKAVLVFLGNMKPDSEIERKVNEMLGDETRVRFIPYTDHMRAAYAASHIALALGIEAFGRVTAEAGAMERIVIGVNAAATPEVCRHGETGFIVTRGDVGALHQAMETILGMGEATYRAMGKRARAHIVDNYNATRLFEQTRVVYNEV